MNVAVIGAGLIGTKRAQAIESPNKVIAVCDINLSAAEKLAEQCGENTKFTKNWEEVIADSDVEAVFIATTHNWLSKIGLAAINAGKHVFMEKPGGISSADLQQLIAAQKATPVTVMLGYNHRLHPAIQEAKKIIDSGKFGPILFIRAKYGHGARLGYEKEWRFNKELSGGGELVDQGPHLIDLVRMFMGPMDETIGYSPTVFWDTPQDDTAFFLQRNKKNQYAQLSVSCVEWKNLFQFEIMCKTGKLQIDGLGRSYGQEKLTVYSMKPEMGPPDIDETLYPEYDMSWQDENEIFFSRIANADASSASLEDGKYVWDTVEKIYSLNSQSSLKDNI